MQLTQTPLCKLTRTHLDTKLRRSSESGLRLPAKYAHLARTGKTRRQKAFAHALHPKIS